MQKLGRTDDVSAGHAPRAAGWLPRTGCLALLALALTAPDALAEEPSPCSQPEGTLWQDLSPLEKAVCAIGGAGAMDNRFKTEATGLRAIYGEGKDAHEPPQPVATFASTTSVSGDDLRVDRRTTIFAGTPIEREIVYSEIIRDQLGYIDGVDNWLVTPTTNIPSGRVASIRKQVLLTNPHLYLAMAVADPSLVSEGPTSMVQLDGRAHQVLWLDDHVLPPVGLYVDAATGRISRLETVENDHVFRDVPLVVSFDGWSDGSEAGDLLAFPMHVVLTGRGQTWYDEHRTRVTQHEALADAFTFPPEAHPVYDADQYAWGRSSSQFIQMWCTFGVSKNEQQLTVTPIELAPGVFLLRGAMYNTVVVDQGDSVVVLEAPLYPERSEAVMAWIAATIGKPISHLVVTHHHFDHIGGVRAYVAAGVPIMVGDPARWVLEEAAQASSRTVPDAQQEAQASPQFLPIATGELGVIEGGVAALRPGERVPTGSLEAGRNNVVYAWRFPTSHADDLMVIKVATTPGQPDVLFQSDLFNPDDETGRALSPIWAVELAKGLADIGLDQPDIQLVGGHSGHATVGQLQDFVADQISTQVKLYTFYLGHARAAQAAGLGVAGLVVALLLAGLARLRARRSTTA